jgi:hypothetical protein
MPLLDVNSPLFVAIIISADIAVAILITPRFVMWHIKRNLPKLLDEVSENKELFDKIRNKFMGGIFGAFGGRPPSWGTLAKMAIAQGAQKFLSGSAENPLGTILQGAKVTQSIKEAAG